MEYPSRKSDDIHLNGKNGGAKHWTGRIIKQSKNHFKLFTVHVIANRKQATLSKCSSFQFDCFSLTDKWTIIFDYDTNQRVCFAISQFLENLSVFRYWLQFDILNHYVLFSWNQKKNRSSICIYHRFDQWQCQCQQQ